ncbi:MAG: hypothetical protein Q9212_002435 [Teloschistes hypoglaucus]
MDQSASSSKVTVEYVDPSGIYPVISGDLQKNLPLRNLHWNSATRPLRSIASLHIDLVEAGVHTTSSTTTAPLREPAVQNGAPGTGETYLGSNVGAKRERRHQIPGLRQTPYLKLFFLRCSDVDAYRSIHRKQIREWIRENTPPSQSTASLNTQEFHDAFEWLIVHVVLPDDGRSISHASNRVNTDTKTSKRGSAAVTEKVRADFNGGSKTAVDRVAQIQITRDSESVPQAINNEEPLAGWEEFISKTKALVLSSFDLRVTQYEEDIKERDAQRNIPGWNFNTFFVLKEGLARGFESVGLVEDALTGYQELALGLTSIIEIADDEVQRGDHFKSFTDELSAELKQALQTETPQHQPLEKKSTMLSFFENGQTNDNGHVLGSNILDTNRKPFRELILANEISIFDFRCYLFAKEVSLLLRLANVSGSPNSNESSASGSVETAKSDSQDLLLLAEICRRATEFLAASGRMIRDDLRSSIHPLSRGHATPGLSSVSTFDDTIEDILASWTFSAAQCILQVTRTPTLTRQLQPLLRNLSPSDENPSPAQISAMDPNRVDLPRRTSSLPVHAHQAPNPSSPDAFPSITSLDAARLLPPASLQTGTQELAAQHADLELLKRRIIADVGQRYGRFGIHGIRPQASDPFCFDDMDDIALDGTASNIDGTQNGHNSLSPKTVNGLPDQDLEQVPQSDETFSKAYEDYSTAASYFRQLATFYYNNDWMRLEISMLDMYAQCLQHLDRKTDFCQAGLQLLARLISARGRRYRPGEFNEHEKSLQLGHYLRDVIDASARLQQTISAPLHNFFGYVSLDPYIRHFDNQDGFKTRLKLQNLMGARLEAQEVRVKIVGVGTDQHDEIWLRTEASEVLHPGANLITVQTTTMSQGWYNVELIEVRSANILLVSDTAALRSQNFFGQPVENGTHDPVCEVGKTHVLVWPDEQALCVRLSLSRSIHLGKPRSVEILVSTGRNRITQGRLVLRACSAGLRLHTADAEIRNADTPISTKSRTGSLDLGAFDAASEISVRVPYGLESDLADIKVRTEFTYTVDGREYLHIHSKGLNIQLPLNVNVQDNFQQNALLSNFKIGAAGSIPARISEYNMQSTEMFRVSMSHSIGEPLEIFPRQPLSLVAKIQKSTVDTQITQADLASQSKLLLKLRYACLDKEISTAIEDALSVPLRKSESSDLSRLLLTALSQVIASTLSIHDLETIALSREIPIATFAQYGWESILAGLGPERRAIISSWLVDWHEKHRTIRLPSKIDSRNLLDLAVPVEIPHVPIVVEAHLEICGCATGPGDTPVAALDQSLLAELTIQYSRYWAQEHGQMSSDDLMSITYEFHAGSDIWLIGGQRKAQFSAKARKRCKFSVVLLPQRLGHLLYPSLEVRVSQIHDKSRGSGDSTGTGIDDVAYELDYLNQADGILIVPNLSTSTLSSISASTILKEVAIAAMSATTARKSFVHNSEDIVSTSSSTSNSIAASPEDTPRQSPSATSLSSLDSGSELQSKSKNGKLLDTYGNEFQLPDFTIKQIRDAIPAHCFKRSAAKGLGYVARDIASLAATFYLFHTYLTPENVPSVPLRGLLWGVYTFVQGLFGTGLWVLAHECGHQSFSPSKTLNDTVGWICHSALLVPYFSWKISHGKHHKATGNLERDMVFVPKTREEYASKAGYYAHELSELMEETPIVTAGTMIGQQLVGWLWYISMNVTGHNHHERQPEGRGKGKSNGFAGGVNHFNPSSPLYEGKDAKLILLSDLGLAITAALIITVGRTFGWANVAVWYILPYLWVNHWLVAITFLQHTDPTLPHYEAESWNFARGAAATIDREFGFIGRHLFHGIIETHVLHHYVSTIPFYNADEATEAIKPVMGQHYRSNVEGGPIGFLKSMWRSARMCHWVEPCEGVEGEQKGVLFFRNRNGLGVPPQKMASPADSTSTS